MGTADAAQQPLNVLVVPVRAPTADPGALPTVRRATVGDAAALAAFAARLFRTTYGPAADSTTGGGSNAGNVEAYVRDHFTPDLQRAELADPALVTLVADGDDALAAYAQLRAPRPVAAFATAAFAAAAGDHPSELARFYVDPAWHGRGLAGALMAAVLDTAAQWGATGVWLDVYQRNARAGAFYRRHGFAQCGTAVFQMGAEIQEDWVMARGVG